MTLVLMETKSYDEILKVDTESFREMCLQGLIDTFNLETEKGWNTLLDTILLSESFEMVVRNGNPLDIFLAVESLITVLRQEFVERFTGREVESHVIDKLREEEAVA